MRRAVYPRQRAKRWVATTSLVAEMYNRNTQQKKSQREEVTSQRQNHQTVSLERDVTALCFSPDSNMDGRGAGGKAPRNPTANSMAPQEACCHFRSIYKSMSYEKSGSSSREKNIKA